MKNIGLISDLHLEGSNIELLVNPGWDYLIIAGDLSSDITLLDKFFSYCVPDIPIIYILGNHEYEGKRFPNVVNQYKAAVSNFPNVYILDNESIIIDNIKFIGSTLWSNFELTGIDNQHKSMQFAKGNISDFTYIFTENLNGKFHSFTPEEMVVECEKSINFLEFELKHNSHNGETIVITHFAPHKNSINEKFKHYDNSYWVNDLEHLMGFSKYWFHGHNHTNSNYIVEETNVICNPRGYSKMFNIDSNHEFNRNLIIKSS